jgi:hypothetical protein
LFYEVYEPKITFDWIQIWKIMQITLEKYISKYNLEQVRPILRIRPIYYFFS